MKRYEKMTKAQIVEALADAGSYDWIMDEVTPRPEPGEKFKIGGVTFVALGEEQGGLLAITAEPINELPFDEEDRNDWRTASLRKWLNGEWLESFAGKDMLMPFVSDLTADDGMIDYGTATDYVFLLSCGLYRKYRYLIPKMGNWWWTLTPWTCDPSTANYVRSVSPSGTLSSYYVASHTYGVVAGLLFNLSSFEPAGSECDSRAEAEVDA